jgi:hypothetical protein
VVQAAHTILESCKRWAPDVEVSLIPVLFLAYLVECSLSQLMGAMKNQAHLTHEWLTMAADLLDRQREWMPRDAPGM